VCKECLKNVNSNPPTHNKINVFTIIYLRDSMVNESIYQNDESQLEELNFRNLVLYYFNELKEIRKGAEPLDILSLTERAKLKDTGIIDYKYGETWITKKALKVMSELE